MAWVYVEKALNGMDYRIDSENMDDDGKGGRLGCHRKLFLRIIELKGSRSRSKISPTHLLPIFFSHYHRLS